MTWLVIVSWVVCGLAVYLLSLALFMVLEHRLQPPEPWVVNRRFKWWRRVLSFTCVYSLPIEWISRVFDREGWARVDRQVIHHKAVEAHMRDMRELHESIIAEINAGVTPERAREILEWLGQR